MRKKVRLNLLNPLILVMRQKVQIYLKTQVKQKQEKMNKDREAVQIQVKEERKSVRYLK